MMPKISVIIPVYNGESVIQETINSVLAQTAQNWELIVINDGSTDRTVEKIEAISDSRLSLFSYPNAGVSESRNRGLSVAQGDYISFLDADDLWSPDKLEAQLTALEKHPEAAVAYSWTDYIDESGQWVRPGMHISPQGDVLSELFRANFIENGSNILVRREAIVKVGEFERSLPSGQDWDFYLRLAAHYYFIPISRTQIFYRISQNSTSSNLQRHHNLAIQVIERAVLRNPDRLEPLKRQSLAHIYKYLNCKCFVNPESRKSGFLALFFTYKYIVYESLNPTKTKLLLTFLVKGILLSLLGRKFTLLWAKNK